MNTPPQQNTPGFWGNVWNGVKAGGGQILTGTVEVIGGALTCTGVVSCVGGAVLITDGLSRMWSGGKDSIRGYQGEKTGYGSDDFVGQDFKALCGDTWGETCRNATVGVVSLGAMALENRLATGAASTAGTTRAAGGGTSGGASAASTSPSAQDAVAKILDDPTSLVGKSADEIAQTFNDAGYEASVRQSTQGSGTATVIDMKSGPVNQIRLATGEGRHGVPYIAVKGGTINAKVVTGPQSQYIGDPAAENTTFYWVGGK